MGKINSKTKGKVGELELSNLLKSFGYNTRRTQQFCGKSTDGEADLVGLKGIHIECKRVEKLNIYDAIEQAKNDCKENMLPTVFHRRNRKKWLVTMELEDWLKLYKSYGK